MPRTITFDFDTALERATTQFWRHGYAATSLRDLLRAMGIGEGSFYNTLKSKKGVYLQCLRLYKETEGRKRALALTSAATAAEGVRALFVAMLDCLDNPNVPSRLCMQAAMTTGEVLDDSDLRNQVKTDLSAFRDVLVGRLTRDRDTGLLSADLDPEATASVVMTYSQGFWRMALVDYDRTRFERQVDTFLRGLGL